MIEDPPRPKPVFDLRDYETEEDFEDHIKEPPYTENIIDVSGSSSSSDDSIGKIFKSAADGKITIVKAEDRVRTATVGIGQPAISIRR